MTFIHRLCAAAGLGLLAAGAAFATPTSIIWNPSVDIQAPKTTHLGLDHYSTTNGDTLVSNDLGLTYGVAKGLEVGVDYITPLSKNFQFNAKFGVPEKGKAPAFAVGAQFFGDRSTAPNIFYALAAKTLGPKAGRITVGGYTGNDRVLAPDKSGVIAAWDMTFNDKWWGAIDYSSGDNSYGQISAGGAYKFAPNASFLLALMHFPKLPGLKNQITAQVDFDF